MHLAVEKHKIIVKYCQFKYNYHWYTSNIDAVFIQQYKTDLSPVYTTLNFWFGTDKIGTRTTFFGSWTIYLAKPRLHYAQFLVPYHFLVLGLPK